MCLTIVTPGRRSGCGNALIPKDVQAQVLALAGPGVRFVADPPFPRRMGDAPVVTFGALHIHGSHASLAVGMTCGPLCGRGRTFVLVRAGDSWRITGTTGPEWIS